MKRLFAILLAALLLSGCASLNVSWSLSASYNTNTVTKTEAVHATSPVQPASAAK